MNNCDDKCNNDKSGFFSLSPEEYVILAFAVSFIIGEGLDENERAILGNFLEAVGVNIVNLTTGAWEV